MSWGIAFAWPGCEDTAPLLAGRWPNPDAAIERAELEARTWEYAGRDVTRVSDREWVISHKDAPDKPRAKLVVRSE